MPPATVRPPSTVSTRPVTQEDSSEARNATAEAMSDSDKRSGRGPEIRVNAVVKTRFAEALYEGREAEVADGYPLRRLGVPLSSVKVEDNPTHVAAALLVLDIAPDIVTSTPS